MTHNRSIPFQQIEGPLWDWSLIARRCRLEAARIVRRPDDAEEVVQEALARAWRGRRGCRTPDAPLPWCLQITRNEALRLIGRRRGSPLARPLEDGQELADLRALGQEEQTLVRLDVGRALQALTPHERLLITLRYDQDFSHSEIAIRLEIPEATARVRLHRARKRLKLLLAEPS
jgi:RNA polymerase sigma-70 factor (ECF subfamily)